MRGRPTAADRIDASGRGFALAGRAVVHPPARRIGLQEHQIPLHLGIRSTPANRPDGGTERPVVENPSVHERGAGRLRAGQLVDAEEPLPLGELAERGFDLRQAHGRERARDRRRGTAGECEPAVVGTREVVATVAELEVEDVPMGAVVHQRGVFDDQIAVVAIEVGRRHEEVEPMVRRHQRRAARRRRAVVHRFERVV